MKRQIKFRIWDKELKSFVCESEYLGSSNGLIEKDWPLWRQTINRNFSSQEDFQSFCDKNFIIQQFTGLRDNNGKDIYEDDIVKLVNAEGWSDNFKGPVGFYNGTYIIPDLDVALGDFKVEIIGNIYENPELLK